MREGDRTYRWVLVIALALIVNVGYGAIFYSFSVLIGKDAAASEFPRAILSAALGLGLISSGILALLVGVACDVLGPRRVFLAGALLGALGLAAFSQARSEWQVILAWALLLGPAMACTFYEPAYVAIDQWFGEKSATAIGVLTVVAGLSSAIFIPLSQWLVEIGGWRLASLALGGILLTLIWALALLAVRDRPREQARRKRLNARAAYRAMLYGLRQTNRTFWLVSAAFFLALAGTFGMLFHQVAYLQDLGFPAGRVAAVVGLIGITSLPARFAVPALASRVRPSRLITAVFALLALSGLTLADTEEWWRVYLYVVLFGAVFGSVLPMRAVAMSSHFSGAVYGRLMGAQQTMLAFAMAGGPFLTGLLRDTLGDYLLPWLGMSVLLASAIPLILATDRA